MSFADTDYRARIRQYLDDTETSHPVKPDDLSNQLVLGQSKTQFLASNSNLVAASVKFSADGAAYTATGLTIDDAAMGVVTVPSAPVGTLALIYFYQFFLEADIDRMRAAGLQKVGQPDADFATLPEGLFTPACRFAAADGARELAQRFARMYSTSTQGQSAEKQQISEKYQALAADLEETAEKERLAFWGNRFDGNTEANSEDASPCYPGQMPPMR